MQLSEKEYEFFFEFLLKTRIDSSIFDDRTIYREFFFAKQEKWKSFVKIYCFSSLALNLWRRKKFECWDQRLQIHSYFIKWFKQLVLLNKNLILPLKWFAWVWVALMKVEKIMSDIFAWCLSLLGRVAINLQEFMGLINVRNLSSLINFQVWAKPLLF